MMCGVSGAPPQYGSLSLACSKSSSAFPVDFDSSGHRRVFMSPLRPMVVLRCCEVEEGVGYESCRETRDDLDVVLPSEYGRPL